MSEWIAVTPNGCLTPVDYLPSYQLCCPPRPKRKRKSSFKLLHSAACNGRLLLLRLILAFGGDPDRRDKHGTTPLHIAAWNNRCRAVELLAKRASNIDTKDNIGHTALFKSVWRGCEKCAASLLAAGATHALKDLSGSSVLMFSAEIGLPGMVELLLAAGAEVDVRNFLGESALFIAISRDHLKCAQKLIQASSCVDLATNDTTTPLFSIVARKYLSLEAKLMMFSLLQANADPNHACCTRVNNVLCEMSPCQMALHNSHTTTAAALWQAGCDINVFSQKTANQPNHTTEKIKVIWDSFVCLTQIPRPLTLLCRNRLRQHFRLCCVPCNANNLQRLGLPNYLVALVDLRDVEVVLMNDGETSMA